MRLLIRYFCIGLVFWPFALHAQGLAGLGTDSGAPLVVTADKALEWHRNDTYFTAKGAALAQQGDSSVSADDLRADYRKSAKSSMEIYRLRATGSVVLTSADNKAYGEKADYDLDKGLAVLSGGDLRMVSPDQTVTAQDRFEYHVAEGRLKALGRAKITRPKPQGGVDTLEANEISALLKDNGKGQKVLDTLEAHGNVVIVTPAETITGAYGIYRAGTNKAALSGGVKILRGPNVLEGERAEVDLTTNISRIFGGTPQSGERVRGVFYPESEKKPDNAAKSE